MPSFRLVKGSLQDRFMKSRAKIQFVGGGFANGKTSSACIKALELARDYPGSNGLIARSTYPKLNDTIRKEFLKWCPADWIKSFPRSQNASNTCTMKNGTTINFRYIQQQGKGTGEATTSNLLSATYDWIIIDQIEDPEIVEKDFQDLLGRLRGNTKYVGSDPTMPETGPRWFIITSNPTRNWVYRKLVKPLHDLMPIDPETGKEKRRVVHPDLMCKLDENSEIILDEDGYPVPMIELFEGSTYENKDNLEIDYIQGLEASYKGQMRDRFLLGKWAAYEGLVYPQFNEDVHVVSHEIVERYFRQLNMMADKMVFIEGYDHGLAVPSCYMLGFADTAGNVIIMDGFYEAERSPESIIEEIKEIRERYGVPSTHHMFCDPDIFRRKSGDKKTVGKALSDTFHDGGIYCERGENSIVHGILKVGSYMYVHEMHQHPMLGTYGAPFLYVSDKCQFFIDEINDYYWKRDPAGEVTDIPMDKDDHACDTLKYMLSKRPKIAKLLKRYDPKPVGWQRWGERDIVERHSKAHRHG